MEKEELLQRINKSVPLMAELAKSENVIADYPKAKSKAYKWLHKKIPHKTYKQSYEG